MQQINAPSPGTDDRAAVILASPKFATWLNDKSFMADLVSVLQRPGARDAGAVSPRYHIAAAVVDGLSPRAPSRELQEGLSIHLGLRKNLLPYLWASTSTEDAPPTKPQRADSEPSSTLSILLPRQRKSDKDARITLTLPLANTMFQNGRRSTLLVSEWAQADGPHMSPFKLVRMAEKRNQVIDLPPTPNQDKVTIRLPVSPITQPRKVLEGLGNILARIEINGEPSPASKELQANITRLLQARGALSPPDSGSGRPGVWALVYPKHMFFNGENLIRFNMTIGARYLGTALHKLAFDMSTDTERMAWEVQPCLRNAVFRGARLHRICEYTNTWSNLSSI